MTRIRLNRPDGRPDIVLGTYCQSPDGRIAYASGRDVASYVVLVHYDDDTGAHAVDADEFTRLWQPRGDLQDYPDARDPRLPYVFDLNWDIKTRSALADRMAEHICDQDSEDPEFLADVTKAMADYNIVLTPEQEGVLEQRRQTASGMRF